MNEYIVRDQQSLIDVAKTNYGSQWVRGVLSIIEHNDVGITDSLDAGQVFAIHDVDDTDATLQEMKVLGIHVASQNHVSADTPVLSLVAVDETSIDLSWTESTGAIGYQLRRRINGGAWEIIELSANLVEYTDEDL